MNNILQINSSIFGDHGNSSQLSNAFVAHMLKKNPEAKHTVRDLAANPLPHINADYVMGMGTAEEERSESQKQSIALSDELIQEVVNADVIVLGIPLYNFNVPSNLQSWFDYIARAGVTFKYTETGPVGLLDSQKKVYVLAARGGMHQGTDFDTQSGFVRNFLAFLGLTNVEFIYAEGLNMGDEMRQNAMDNAQQAIEKTAA